MTNVALLYGWYALVGVALTGTPLYVTNNTREHVEMLDIVPIALAGAERCLATHISNGVYQVTPPEIVESWKTNVYGPTNVMIYTNIMTNVIGHHVDMPMLTDLEASDRSALVRYTSVSNFPTNTLGLYTTNEITYTNWADHVSVDDLQSHYKLLWLMQRNWLPAYPTTQQVYIGSGSASVFSNNVLVNTTNDAADIAYAAAVSNYSLRTNTFANFEQYASLTHTYAETNKVTNSWFQTNLLVSITGNVYVVSTNGIYFDGGSNLYWEDTSIVVTGGTNVSPDVRGIYTSYDPDPNPYVWLLDGTPTTLIEWTEGAHAFLIEGAGLGVWTNDTTGSPAGTYKPYNTSTVGIVTGTIAGSFSALAPVGVFTNNGSDVYSLNGWYIFAAGVSWFCSTNSSYFSDDRFFIKDGDPVGTWFGGGYYSSGDGFYSLVAATSYWDYAYTNEPDPSGTYTPYGDGQWSNSSGRFVAINTNYGDYFLASNTVSTNWEPSWQNDVGGGTWTGTYSTSYGDATGIVTVVNVNGAISNQYGLFTNSSMSYSLRKTGAEYDCYPSTQMQHQTELVVYPVAYSTWTNFALGLVESNWNSVVTNAYNVAGTNSFAYLADVSTVPTAVVGIPDKNASRTHGFSMGTNIQVLARWIWLYGTNKYW